MITPKERPGARYSEDITTSVSISGKHRMMIDSWQFGMEVMAGPGGAGPSVKEAAESLIELGWAMALMPPGRRTAILMEVKDNLMEKAEKIDGDGR